MEHETRKSKQETLALGTKVFKAAGTPFHNSWRKYFVLENFGGRGERRTQSRARTVPVSCVHPVTGCRVRKHGRDEWCHIPGDGREQWRFGVKRRSRACTVAFSCEQEVTRVNGGVLV